MIQEEATIQRSLQSPKVKISPIQGFWDQPLRPVSPWAQLDVKVEKEKERERFRRVLSIFGVQLVHQVFSDKRRQLVVRLGQLTVARGFLILEQMPRTILTDGSLSKPRRNDSVFSCRHSQLQN
jgi:hypothetical protein